MAYTIDDGLDEYEQQDYTPTALEQQSQPQPKSAELAEIEKSLEIVKGIKEIQDNMRSTMSEIKDMAGKADELTKHLEQEVKAVKPLWDQLLEGFTKEILISQESLEAYDKLMLDHTNKILSNVYGKIDKSITENIAGQFNEVANKHLADFDAKLEESVAKHKKAYLSLEKEYEDNIKNLEKNQGKLLKQAVEEKNRIIMPEWSFWTIICIFGLAFLSGAISWVKFWKISGNDEPMTCMIFALVAELAYYGIMVYNHYAYQDERYKKKDNKDEQRIYSVSLSEAIYIIFLTMTSLVYLVWSQLDANSNVWLLVYLLPVALASNAIWLLLRFLAYGIFRKD